MKFTINDKSWHYKYLRKFDGDFRAGARHAARYRQYDFLPHNFCAYWNMFAKLAAKHAFFAILVGFILKCSYFFFFNQNLMDDKYFPHLPFYTKAKLLLGLIGIASICVVIGMAVVVIILHGIHRLFKFIKLYDGLIFGASAIGHGISDTIKSITKRRDYALPKPDGLFKTWYKSWKDKFCPMAEFSIEEDHEYAQWITSVESRCDEGYDDDDHECDCESYSDLDHADESEVEVPDENPKNTPEPTPEEHKE